MYRRRRRFYRRKQNSSNVLFSFYDFDITKQELIASVTIIAFMLVIGFFISENISNWQRDKNEIYNKAAKIDQRNIFDYGMRTNIGNAFVYGDLNAVDTVTYPEIGGEYIYIEKVKERYTMHTRTVTTTVDGQTQTHIETYWTWDLVGSEEKYAKEIEFCGIIFDNGKIDLPSANYIDTIKESWYSDIRYKYYGVDTHYTGTIFANLRDGTIPDKSPFYQKNLEDTYNHVTLHGGWIIFFWIFWIALIAGLTYGFFYLDNTWLE